MQYQFFTDRVIAIIPFEDTGDWDTKYTQWSLTAAGIKKNKTVVITAFRQYMHGINM